MFTFDDWHLSYDGQVLAMQHDNKSRQIIVQGTFPAGYTWAMEVQVGTAWDAIVLSPVSGGLAALLTQDNLAYAGWYEMQLRGAQGDVVRRTNIIRVHVPRSLSGTGQWPTVPSEFTQIEQRIAELNAHPSIPGENGYWLVWDPESQQYKESPYPLPNVSVGPPGQAATVKVSETITSDPGSNAMVENLGTENTALLRFTIPRGQAGPAGATPQLAVTVTTLPPGQQATAQIFGPAETPTITIGIPQGLTGDRGPQGVQGIQGWSVSGAELDEDGALVLTLRNPADGQTQTLPPVPIDNSDALQAVAAAITAQGTTQVQRVEEAGDDAVGAVSTAKDAALEAVGQAQDTATGAVASAKTTAVRAVQDAQETATTDISQAQTDAVSAVEGAKADALESVGALVQQAENAAIRQPIISDNDTWMIWDAESGQYVDTGLYAGGQAPYIGEDGYWYVGNVKTDTLAQGPAGPAGAGVPSTEGVPTDYLLSPAGWVAPPSGGNENWELIIDHVVPETVAYVLIDQDLNGEAFSLKKWALLTIWLPDENVSTRERCQVGFHPSSGWSNGSIYETAKAPTNEETASCTLAFCSFTNGLIKLDDIYWSVNFTNIAYVPNRQYEGTSQSGGIKIDSSTKEIVSTYRDSYATCVKINTISRTAVRKGSVIRLWGVRA